MLMSISSLMKRDSAFVLQSASHVIQVAVRYLLAGHTAAADPTWMTLIACAFAIGAVFGGMVINSCGSPSCDRGSRKMIAGSKS